MERKVILNGCFGGYGWSRQGAIEVLKAKGFQNQDLHFWVYADLGDYQEVTMEEFLTGKELLWYIVTSDEDVNKTMNYDVMYHNFDREDPEAIKVLEERGSKFCSGWAADLYIDTFDDEYTDYEIDEYDGVENLRISPQLTRDQILKCGSVYDVADLLEKLGVVKKTA